MAFSKNIFPTSTWEVAAWENDFGKVPKDFLTGLGEILKMGLKELSLGKNI